MIANNSVPSIAEKLAFRYIDKYGLHSALVAFFTDVMGEGITIDEVPISADLAALTATWIVGEE